MAIIDDITDIPAAGDQVSHLWLLDVASKIQANQTNITANTTAINQINTARNELLVTAGTGLSVNFNGGRLILPNGSYITVAPASLAVPASSVVWVFVNSAGTVQHSTIVPPAAWEIARVTTDATAVTAIDVAPHRYLLDRPQKIVQAVKSTNTNLNPDGISYGIPGFNAPVNVGSVFNPSSGVLTIPATWRIRVEASVLVYSTGVTSLDGKLSLFNGTTEMKCLSWLRVPTPAQAPSVMMLQGFYETREDQDIGGVNGTASITLQLLFRTGTASFISADNNTTLQVWRTG